MSMIPYYITPIIVLVAAIIAGIMDGAEEAGKIRRHAPINHVWEWGVRVIMLLIGMGLSWAAFAILGTPYVKLVCVAGIAIGAFVPLHRYTLNKRRGVLWWNMGPLLQYRKKGDSVIDGLWHSLAWIVTGMERVTMDHVLTSGHHSKEQVGHNIYPNKLPAKLAFGFDAIVVAASISTYYFL